ncbi:release factor glutamine methyltransferase [Salmonella enterica subsp. enterica serovar Choleraesuis]|nr:release factor glutamine methyltransferase [Salmonella enterica subsp. enterica serovar Choleraesuis]
MTFRDWIIQAKVRLAQSESPRRDAEILLEKVTGKGRSWIMAFDETELSPAQCEELETLLARRERGEPVAWLTGEREFWSLPLEVSEATLIPRPDTECLVEQALAVLPAQPCCVLDLGTGTGAIALALASERPDCEFQAVDRIADAVALAQRNAGRLGLANVSVMQSDWFNALEPQHQFAVIVSNPPYIDERDPHLDQGDVRFEPRSALVADDNGLADLRTIIQQAAGYLTSGGWLLLEHGWQQAEALRAIFTAAGFEQVASFQDYGGNERVTAGRTAILKE